MTFAIGDKVKDGSGDTGTVLKATSPSFFVPEGSDVPVFGDPQRFLVCWKTLNGSAAAPLQASWEDASDLEAA